ncbi:sensor histidine kinase [Amycolatopsis lurida]
MVNWQDGRWEEVARTSGPSRFPLRWVVISSVLLLPFVIPATVELLEHEHRRPVLVLSFALMAAYCAGYLAMPVLLPVRRVTTRLAWCIAHLAAGFALLVLFGDEHMYLMVYSISMIAFALPTPIVLATGGVAVLGLTGWLLAEGRFLAELGDLVTVVSVSIAMFFMGRLSRMVRRLRAAQEEIATLAVSAERERLARDLHDLLGHSITTIAVKAGLARRVLETAHDERAAIEEIRSIEALARSTLSDVRATVTEYREVSLPAELAGAREALRAAEIRAELPSAVDDVRPELRGVFGYVVREAVTNVIRHSGARVVRVSLGEDWIEITDDGTNPPGAPGNGLRGLGERLAAAGGSIHAEPVPTGGFRVRASAGEAAA